MELTFLSLPLGAGVPGVPGVPMIGPASVELTDGGASKESSLRSIDGPAIAVDVIEGSIITVPPGKSPIIPGTPYGISLPCTMTPPVTSYMRKKKHFNRPAGIWQLLNFL